MTAKKFPTLEEFMAMVRDHAKAHRSGFTGGPMSPPRAAEDVLSNWIERAYSGLLEELEVAQKDTARGKLLIHGDDSYSYELVDRLIEGIPLYRLYADHKGDANMCGWVGDRWYESKEEAIDAALLDSQNEPASNKEQK